MNKKKIILAAGVVLVLAVAGFWIFGKKNAQGKVDFVTEKVTRGNISNSITATGTIEPVTEVEVGTQVSGIIDKIYIDYNSVVKQGEVIGYVGTTGNSTGNHLHFEVWQNGERTDALGFFKAE